jgi:hypothetical protein
MQQLRSTRSASSTLIDQYITDCRSVEESLQINVHRINEDIQTILSTCNRSVGKERIFNIFKMIFILRTSIKYIN